MKVMIDIPESEQLLKEYHVYMDLIKDLKNGTVGDKGHEIIYKAVKSGIPFEILSCPFCGETIWDGTQDNPSV